MAYNYQLVLRQLKLADKSCPLTSTQVRSLLGITSKATQKLMSRLVLCGVAVRYSMGEFGPGDLTKPINWHPEPGGE